MNYPSISIIIPVYQVAEFILLCLESVAGQAYPGQVEVILVDDCGNDESMAIAKSFIAKYQGPFSFHVLAHSQNKGLSAARNTGMQHATGDYLLFVDSDDELLPNALMSLAKPLSLEPFDIVVGRIQLRDAVHDYETSYFNYGITELRGSDIFREYVRFHIPVAAWNKLCRRQMLVDHPVLFPEGIIHEDELWSFHLSLIAKSLYIIEEKTYLYKIRPEGLNLSKNTERRVNSLHFIVTEIQKLAVDNNLQNDVDVFRRIDSLRTRILSELCADKARFIQEYCSLRRSDVYSWCACARMAGFHPLKQLRLLHYALPDRLGAICYFNRLRRNKKW